MAACRNGWPKAIPSPTTRRRRATATSRRGSNNTLVRSVDDVFGLIDSKREQIVDARAANRFRGEVPEPRAGLRVGHMPGAFNLPYNDLLDPKTGTMLPADKLAARIAASGIDPSKKVTASCGSGVTACVVGARPLPHRRAGSGDLRRFLDRVGRPCRHAYRHRNSGNPELFRYGDVASTQGDIQALLGRDISCPRQHPQPASYRATQVCAAFDRELISPFTAPRRRRTPTTGASW